MLYEEEHWFVLFAKRPRNEGHLLIIPKAVSPKFYDLPNEIIQRGFQISVKLSRILDDIYGPPRVTLFVKGLTINEHSHIHLIPTYSSEDVDKDLNRPELSTEQMFKLAEKFNRYIAEIMLKV